MPFTLAHPAAIVPLYKARPQWFVLSALIVGSLVPDTEYFVRRQLLSEWSHTFLGLFAYCLPVGLILLWLYHTYQKAACISLLPVFIQGRLVVWSQPLRFFPAQRLCMISLSIVLGAATHLAWDSLTHANGLLSHWKLLTTPRFAVAGVPIPMDRLLQDGSTIGGLLLLTAWLRQALTHIVPQPIPLDFALSARTKRHHCIGLALISLLVASGVSLLLGPAVSTNLLRRPLQQAVLSLVPAWYLTLTAYAVGRKLQQRGR